MAFALTDARFYKVEIPSAIDKRGLQGIELTVTKSAAGDTDLDIGNTSGTFWTAAIANGTYGTQADLALKQFKLIASSIEALVSCEITAANGFMLRVASVSGATQYALTNGGSFPAVVPEITLANDAAPATLKIRMLLSLVKNVNTVDFTF